MISPVRGGRGEHGASVPLYAASGRLTVCGCGTGALLQFGLWYGASMSIDHSKCDHPRTPAGRRACREGRATPAERTAHEALVADVAASVPLPETPHRKAKRAAHMRAWGAEPGKDDRAALPFARRCGNVHCGYDRLDEHIGQVSCLRSEDGNWKSNVDPSARAFRRAYPPR